MSDHDLHPRRGERPPNLTGAYREYELDDIEWIARQFSLDGIVVVSPFRGKGNINLHTYLVLAGEREYLLQRVNSVIFNQPYRVMTAMQAAIAAQSRAALQGEADPLWTSIELVPTRGGEPFLDLSDGHGLSVWRLMVRIPRTVCYKSLAEIDDRERRLDVAEQTGRGLGIYSRLTSTIEPEGFEASLPGYRDTQLYYRQFRSVLAGNRTPAEAADLLPEDPILRESAEAHFCLGCDAETFRGRLGDPELQGCIELALRHEPLALALWTALGDGRLRPSLIHGDTKLENFLFCPVSGRVRALVDLDTIMSFTWLADYGDMLRSLVNVAGEKERDLDKVRVDFDVYDAVARGFMSEAPGLDPVERGLMTVSAQALALELGVRFLADYLRGDTYFRPAPEDPPDVNKVRARAQFALFEQLLAAGPACEARLAALA